MSIYSFLLEIRRRRRHGAIALLALIAACNWGTRPKSFPPAQGPEGVRVAVRVSGEPADRLGELAASDSVGVTILTDDRRLVRIAWGRVEAMDVSKLGADFNVRYGEHPSLEKRQRLALASRFPQGLSGTLLTRTLSALHQDALQELR